MERVQVVKKYPCGRKVSKTGEPCDFSTNRKYNLTHHQERWHGKQSGSVFLNYVAVDSCNKGRPSTFGRDGIDGHVTKITPIIPEHESFSTRPLSHHSPRTATPLRLRILPSAILLKWHCHTMPRCTQSQQLKQLFMPWLTHWDTLWRLWSTFLIVNIKDLRL